MDFLKNNKRLSFLYDNEAFGNLETKTSFQENGNSLVTEYLLEDGLKVTNIARKYPKYDAYEWVTWFENTGKAPSKIISELNDCDVELPFEHDEPKKRCAFLPDPEENMLVYSPSGSTWQANEFYCDINKLVGGGYINHIHPGETKKYATTGGRSSEKTAPFFNVSRQGKGVIFAIGWTGQWNCSIGRSCDAVNIKTKIEDTNFRLYPGEKIRTSSFVMMNYECDVIDSQNKWRRLVKEEFSIIGKPGRDHLAPLCAGIWGGMTSKAVIERVNTIKENQLPFEYIWMDAGWYGEGTKPSPDEFEGDWWQHCGNWNVNKNIHPDGLLEVRKAIKDAGKKFLLWFEPERVTYSAPIVAQHPEYFIADGERESNLMLLDLGNSAAWQYCFDMLCEKIDELQIDCYRQDFNIDPLPYWRSSDSWDRQGITEIKHIMGMYSLLDRLLEKYPHLLIDNCASGGRRLDIEMMKRSIPLWRSDAQCPANYPAEIAQAHNMNFSTWLPFSGTGSGRIWGKSYIIRSSYSAALTTNYAYSERDQFPVSQEQIDWIKKYTTEYLSARPYYSCDFYPLTESMGGNDAWCASQFNRPEENDGIIQVFKRKNSPYPTAVFNLRGIDGNKTYTFTDADDNSSFEIKGVDLINNGLKISIEEKPAAKLYFYHG